jgi:hypothetical protein
MRRSIHVRLAAIGLAVAALASPAPALGQAETSDPGLEHALALTDLLNSVPPDIRTGCMPFEVDVPGSVVGAQCLAGDVGIVLYVRFTDEASLQAAYDQFGSIAGVAADSGTSCADGAFEGPYPDAGGTVAGRLLCQASTDGPAAIWTDDRQVVLGALQATQASDFAALHEAWLVAHELASPGASPLETPAAAPSGPPSATAAPAASLPPAASPALDRGALIQWASGAVASSQYGETSWSAAQATGPTDTTVYGDQQTAWAPAVRDAGLEWLEVSFDQAVVPSEVVIHESSGNGFVTSVELWDPATQSWVLAWEGQDQSPPFVVGFSPDLTPVDFATDRVRVTIDTAVEDWNEIDAVALIGEPVAEEPPSDDAPADGPTSAPTPAETPREGSPSADESVAVGALLEQWASQATASSQYGTDAWGASQATGAPDTAEYGDQPTSWAPSGDDVGPAWLELAYDTPVIPTGIVIWETSGSGFVTRIQVWDDAGSAWVTLWEGTDGSAPAVVGFSPELAPVDFATDRVRVDVDTTVPEWNEVDAVALVGRVPEGS